MDMCTLLYLKYIINQDPGYSTGNSALSLSLSLHIYIYIYIYKNSVKKVLKGKYLKVKMSVDTKMPSLYCSK